MQSEVEGGEHRRSQSSVRSVSKAQLVTCCDLLDCSFINEFKVNIPEIPLTRWVIFLKS